MSFSCLMFVYSEDIIHLFGYFLHQHEACGHVQAVDKGKEAHEEIFDKGLLEYVRAVEKGKNPC